MDKFAYETFAVTMLDYDWKWKKNEEKHVFKCIIRLNNTTGLIRDKSCLTAER